MGVFPAYAHWIRGDGRAAVEWSARVLGEVGTDSGLGREIIGFSPRVSVLTVRAAALTFLGRLEEASSEFKVAERAAEESQDLEVLIWVELWRVKLAQTGGGTESVLQHGRRSVEIAEKLDTVSSRVFAYCALGIAHLTEGQSIAARDALRESVAFARDRAAIRSMLPEALSQLAAAHLALGDRAEATAAAAEAIDIASAGGSCYFEAQAQLILGAALLATDGVVPRAEIESALARAERLVESIDGRSLSPRILEMRGSLAAVLGDVPASDKMLQQALELYRAIGAKGHAQRLAREIAP
jgi:tetratricopeptide (TPR) repeat protein